MIQDKGAFKGERGTAHPTQTNTVHRENDSVGGSQEKIILHAEELVMKTLPLSHDGTATLQDCKGFLKEGNATLEGGHREQALTFFKQAVAGYKYLVKAKPQSKVARKGLVLAWYKIGTLYPNPNVFHSIKKEYVTQSTKKKKSIVKKVMSFINNFFIENEWKSQYLQKYGGYKERGIQWKEWYLKCEEEEFNLPTNRERIQWSIRHGHYNFLKHLISEKPELYKNMMQSLSFDEVVKRRDIKTLITCIEAGVSVDHVNDDKHTLVHLCLLFNFKEGLEYLISKGASTRRPDKNGVTPLVLAIFLNYTECSLAILSNMKEKVPGWTPDIEGLVWAIVNQNVILVEELLKTKTSLSQNNPLGFSLLHYACLAGNGAIIKCLINSPLSVDQKDVFKRTPLHWAALFGHLEAVKTLVHAGALINEPDMYQETPLESASYSGHAELITYLASIGATI